MRTRPELRSDRIGLWGVSQGGWVIGMAAAEAPQEIAFIISVSGAGISVAEQQVYGVKAQTRAMGVSGEDVAKVVLFSRLLVDWQLSKPIFREVNEADAGRLGNVKRLVETADLILFNLEEISCRTYTVCS